MNFNLYQAEDFAADESFIAYCQQTDEAAIIFWKDWIAHHPEKLDEIYNAEQLVAKLSLKLDAQELQEVFSKFDDFIDADQTPLISRRSNGNSRLLMRVAFAAVVIIGFGFGIYQFYESQNSKIDYITVHNGNGKITGFLLSDGTKISLNANSTLKYPKVFKGYHRDVELNGEAFFEVAKDKSRPFSVHTNGLKTTVLGTKFNVAAYPDVSNVAVALVEGRVEVQTAAGRDKMILNPSEMAVFDNEKHNLVRTSFDTASITAWKSGNIVFNNASFSEIAFKLKHLYGIQLVDHTKNLKWNYSGEFEKTDYLTIVKSICFAKKINYKQTNQTFILTN